MTEGNFTAIFFLLLTIGGCHSCAKDSANTVYHCDNFKVAEVMQCTGSECRVILEGGQRAIAS